MCVEVAVNITGCMFKELWRSRRSNDVEARKIIITWLSGYGFTDQQIATLTGLTRQGG